jgi:hypothetical protein
MRLACASGSPSLLIQKSTSNYFDGQETRGRPHGGGHRGPQDTAPASAAFALAQPQDFGPGRESLKKPSVAPALVRVYVKGGGSWLDVGVLARRPAGAARASGGRRH